MRNSNQTFQGKITMVRLNPTIQSNVVTHTTVAEVNNADLRLKPGMTASMRIEVSRRDNVMRIPNAALRFRPNNDMYAALKQEPPTPARGRSGRHRRADRRSGRRRLRPPRHQHQRLRLHRGQQPPHRAQRHSHRLRRPTAEATGSATATRAGPIPSRVVVSALVAAEVAAAAAG